MSERITNQRIAELYALHSEAADNRHVWAAETKALMTARPGQLAAKEIVLELPELLAELETLRAELHLADVKLKRVNDERAEVYQARTGNSENGLPLWQHTCGAVEAFLSSELAEIKGGCDACESGSDNPEAWQELYRGPVYGRWTQEDVEHAKAAAAERWGRLSEFIEPAETGGGHA